MDVPLAGLGVFGGWIVLVVATDVFGLFRISQRRMTTAFLVVSIAGAIVSGYAYLQEKHATPCSRPPAHARR